MADKKARRKSAAKSVALVGMMAATLECGKLVLAALPNIEVVTILLSLYGYVFGLYGVASAFVFVSIEPLIYGFGTWTLSYYLYWPFVALVFMMLARLHVKNRFVFVGVTVLLTAWFGVLKSLVDVGLFSGAFDNFWYRFTVYYTRGLAFYVTQIICNAVLSVFLFKFLADKLFKVKNNII